MSDTDRERKRGSGGIRTGQANAGLLLCLEDAYHAVEKTRLVLNLERHPRRSGETSASAVLVIHKKRAKRSRVGCALLGCLSGVCFFAGCKATGKTPMGTGAQEVRPQGGGVGWLVVRLSYLLE